MKEEKFVKYMLDWIKITTKEEEELKLEREIKQAESGKYIYRQIT